MRKNKIAFITSLEHSGSTILDLTISRHPKFISCGEVFRTLSPGRNIEDVLEKPCNCGKKAKNCELWGPVLRTIKKKQPKTWVERYKIFLEHFYSLFGEDKIPVDSSKFLRAVKKYKYLEKDFTIKGIFIIRDVRGWVYSIKLSEKRKKEPSLKTIFDFKNFKWQWKAYLRIHLLRKIPGFRTFEWFYRNRKILNTLENLKLDFLIISYEELNFNPNIFQKIFEFLDEDYTELGNAKSHIVDGNRTAFKGDFNLRYDLKWMANQINLISLYFPIIRNFNKRYVWGWFHENREKK